MLRRVLALSLLASAAADEPVVLATFDSSSKGTERKWVVMNDPVMGGQSHSSYVQSPSGYGNFSGLCALVPFLHAPGFCKMATQHSLFTPAGFDDASAWIGGSLHITLKTPTPGYGGFKASHILGKGRSQPTHLA